VVTSIEDYERHDMSCLKELKSHKDFKNGFSISRLQRHLKIGYNRASRLVDAGLTGGVLVRCSCPAHFVKCSGSRM
jgi:DNA segregation ATPase FtsK/SpoIIIE-like protein